MFTTYDVERLLKKDHERMNNLFHALHDTQPAQREEKELLIYELFSVINLHFQINESVLYPEIEKRLMDYPMIEYAQGLQNEVFDLMSQIEVLSVEDPAWNGLITEMEDSIREHIKNEELEICSRFQAGSFDDAALGRKLADKRYELLSEDKGWRKSA